MPACWLQEDEEDEEGDDGVVWMTDTSAEAVKRRAEEQLTAATAALVTQGNIELEAEEARKKAAKEEAARKLAEEEMAARVQVLAHARCTQHSHLKVLGLQYNNKIKSLARYSIDNKLKYIAHVGYETDDIN